ncbi:MAG: LytTR family DNA-binding domain-containing protein [Balneolaceae bacterium]|nr:LytTR family DNA-binding domain-containing protein [Balneolaceae bacterium]
MNRLLTCLIVDDEPAAQQVLQQYIDDTPWLVLKKTCSNAFEGMEYLDNQTADILFLDVNMPKLSGIDFLKSMKNPPAVILSTAYDDYALEGYELDVIDYLLKPFSFERFLQAVRKAKERVPTSTGSNTISVKSDGRIYRVLLDEIRLLESQGDYVTMHLSGRKITFYDTLKNLEEELPSDQFARVHKSYIVNLSCVDYLEGNVLKLGDLTIPIGNTYRDKIRTYFE